MARFFLLLTQSLIIRLIKRFTGNCCIYFLFGVCSCTVKCTHKCTHAHTHTHTHAHTRTHAHTHTHTHAHTCMHAECEGCEQPVLMLSEVTEAFMFMFIFISYGQPSGGMSVSFNIITRPQNHNYTRKVFWITFDILNGCAKQHLSISTHCSQILTYFQ